MTLDTTTWKKEIIALVVVIVLSVNINAQDTVRYTGNTLVNVDYHHGQLSPVVGVHNIQVFRANRETRAGADSGWTYNHAPMLAYWNNQFYLEYLSNPVGEHVAPGQTLIVTSKDGYTWTKPSVVFPPYKIPDGYQKPGYPGVAKNLYAVNHQRMGFYVSSKNLLLVLAYYGIVMDGKDDPNDGKGIGRVVREAYKDGTYGPIYFIRFNSTWDQSISQYPLYTKSNDKGFVEACNEILAKPLLMQQWVEEADRNDPLIPLKKEVKAFSYYHLKDGRVVGLWKNALTSISKDEGKTWIYSPLRAPKFVNSNAKIWGQKTSDGKYITVYNPSEFRWPLALSVSNDGLNYNNLLLVNGEISPMRYGGNYKSYGPQYVRGINEGDGTPPGGNAWVTYSMNKEDIWISSIPVPANDRVIKDVNENFDKMPAGKELQQWNIYSALWAPVRIEEINNSRALVLRDSDPYEYAKAEHLLPAAKKMIAEFSITPQQNDKGQLDIEFQDAKGYAALRLTFDAEGNFYTKAGYRNRNFMKYNPNEKYTMNVEIDTDKRSFTITANGKKLPLALFFAPIDKVERIVFRTGGVRRFPDSDTPTDPMHEALPGAGTPVPEAVFIIHSLATKKLQ